MSGVPRARAGPPGDCALVFEVERETGFEPATLSLGS